MLKAIKPYLKLGQSVKERFSTKTRYLATSNRLESELEKPYDQLEYEAMHNDPIGGWDDPGTGLINPPDPSPDPDLPPIPDLPDPWVPPGDPGGGLPPIPDLPDPWVPPDDPWTPPGGDEIKSLDIVCEAAPLCDLASVCLGWADGTVGDVRVIATTGELLDSGWSYTDDILTVEFLVDNSVESHVITIEVEDTDGNIASAVVEITCVVSSTGETAVWIFDQTSGTITTDEAGNLIIVWSGIDDPGSWGTVDGKACITLDGTDYGSASGEVQILFSSSFSVACWFNLNATLSDYEALCATAGPGLSNAGFYLIIDTTGDLYFQHKPGNGENTLFTLIGQSAYSGPTGWEHVVVTVDATEGPKMYVNGAQLTGANIGANMGIAGSFVYTYAEVLSDWSSYPLGDFSSLADLGIGVVLGIDGIPDYWYFNGSIAGIGFYNSALSSAEVTALYNAG